MAVLFDEEIIMAHKQLSPKPRVITFKASDEVREWLKTGAKSGYRSLSAQIALLLDAARKAEDEKNAAH